MSKKLYVGNLPYQISEDALREAFAAFGEVLSARIITDETGRSKGFGFVEMASDEEAENAISSLNGSSLSGRNVVVNEARPRPEGGRSGFGGPRRSSGGGRGPRRQGY